jgi:hypothetical protein
MLRPSPPPPGHAIRSTAARLRSWQTRAGGVAGNEILTSAAAVVLVVLLAAEAVTIVDIRGLLTAHMFIGLVLIPPAALKLGSTGYRAARYYAHAAPYRRKGPPLLPLRVLAPVLTVSTIAVLVSGVLLLAAGNKSGGLLEIHKVSFIVFAVVFVPHFLAYVPRVVRSLRSDWRPARRREVAGSGVRAMLVAFAVGAGLALAVALLPTIHGWHG